MAAVLDKQDPAAKNGSQVDEQIAQATSRIRAHDLAFGGLVLLALVLVYATAVICLDRYFVLPDWVRQVGLLGFVGALAGTAHVTLVGPLRQRINPLYAARQVERTIDDAKNSVTGYVDAQQKGDLNSTVKAALASRAAKSVAEADVNRAVDHRSLIYLGAVSVALLLALIVLFFVFRPTQFASLLGRAFNPFASIVIASRTQIALVKPDPAEPTITTGQSITVAVHISGKVPNADGPDRVRLLVRHNLADPNYDELPMVRGESSRDWELRVPDYLVQNGFWYKVVAGDDATAEYKVTVRSLPMFTEFQTTYEYPKYLRRKPDSATGPLVSAYRGTTATFVARTNREVRDGLMVIEPSNTRVPGTIVPGQPDALQFVFKVTESGKYKLAFNATNGEHTADTFQSTITVETDAAPQVIINKPEDEEITEPVNGFLKVDGKVGDDFGIDTVTLKMRIVSPVERPLPDVPYMNGKTASFRREKDDSWPTDLDYKGSVDFAKLKKDATGLDLELTPDTVIEYWLEATDNCTEPKANVGRSQPKKVKLTPPKVEEAEQKELDNQKDERQNEEKKHSDQQKQQLDRQKRDPKEKGKTDPKADRDQKQGDQKQGDQDAGAPKQDNPKQGDQEKTKPNKPNPEQPEPGKKDPGTGDKGMGDPMTGQNDPSAKPNTPDNTDPNKPKPDMPPPPDQNKVEQEANDLANEVKRDNDSGASVKPNPTPDEKDKTDPGQTKPRPMDGASGPGNDAQQKPEQQKQPDAKDPANPMGGKSDAAPASDKSNGDLKKPDDPATLKPDEKKPEKGQKGAAPSETRREPLGSSPGGDKESPKEPQPASKEPNPKQDPKSNPNSGAAGKPASEKKDSQSGGAPKTADKKDAAADAGSKSKPMPENTRGSDKSAARPNDPPADDAKPPTEQEAADGKPGSAPPAGTGKPMPKGDSAPKGADADQKPTEQGANDPKRPNGTDSAGAKPDDPKNKPMGGGGAVEKGTDKSAPDDAKGDKPEGGSNARKNKPDEKQLNELKQAANDLNSADPDKKKAAQDKLDKAIGEEKRKELEQLGQDLKSDDKNKRDAAQKKIEDMKQQMGGGKKDADNKNAPKLDEQQKKELADAANDLNSDDPDKKKAAQDKLDKAIGEEKRKELEQLGQDLKSDDKNKRDAAQKKVDDITKKTNEGKKGGADNKGAQQKLDEQQKKELADAANDLNSADPDKKKAAQDKLDKAIGEEKRKEIEELTRDLQSNDKGKKEAAQKKLENMKKDLENQAGKPDGTDDPPGKEPKEPTPEEIADLKKKAQDLQSKDEKTRQKAQQELDEKIGEENRKKLEEMMKNQKPGDPEQEKKTQEQLEQMAKHPPKQPETDFRPKGLGSSPKAKGPMEEDEKNRRKSLELNLKELEKEENRKLLQAKKGWSDAEYDKFLEGVRERLKQMQKEVEKEGAKPPVPGPVEAPPPLFKSGDGGKVDPLNGSSGPAGVGGPTAAPPGFDKAREKFQEALQKKR